MEEEATISVFSKKLKKRQRPAEQPAQPSQEPRNLVAENGKNAIDGELRVSPPDQGASGAMVQLVDRDGEALTGFRALGVTSWLNRVCESLGIKSPTAVQRGCIPAILEVQSHLPTITARASV